MKPSRHRRGAQFEYALGAPAGALPPGVTISRIDMLRRSGRDVEAAAHLRKVVTQHPDLAVGLLAALRAAGRPADIEMLLDVIAAADPTVCTRVVGALSTSRDLDDLTALLDRLDRRGLPELAAVAAARVASAEDANSASGVNPLTARLMRRPAHEISAAVRDLRRQGREREADDLLAVFRHAPGPVARDVAVDLARQGRRAEAATLLHRFALAAAPSDAAESFSELARTWPAAATLVAPVLAQRPDSARVLAARGLRGPARRSTGAR